MDLDVFSERELMLSAYLDFCASWGAFSGSIAPALYWNCYYVVDELFFAGIVLAVAGAMTWIAAEGKLPTAIIAARLKAAIQ